MGDSLLDAIQDDQAAATADAEAAAVVSDVAAGLGADAAAADAPETAVNIDQLRAARDAAAAKIAECEAAVAADPDPFAETKAAGAAYQAEYDRVQKLKTTLDEGVSTLYQKAKAAEHAQGEKVKDLNARKTALARAKRDLEVAEQRLRAAAK